MEVLRTILLAGGLIALACTSDPDPSGDRGPAVLPPRIVDTVSQSALPESTLAYRVAKWRYFYEGALSLTFDDLDPQALAEVGAVLGIRERRIGATFYLSEAALGRAPENPPGRGYGPLFARLHGEGYEFGALPASGSRNPALAYRQSLDRIRQMLQGGYCFSAAYPEGGPRASDTLAGRFFRTGREKGHRRIYTAYPEDFLRLEDYHLPLLDKPSLDTLMREIIAKEGWAIVTSDRRGGDFRDAMDNILGYHARLWDASVGSVARYIREARSVRVRELRREGDTLFLSMTDRAVPDSIYDEPISMELEIDPGFEVAGFQNGKEIWVSQVTGKVRFSAVPDGGEIMLRRR